MLGKISRLLGGQSDPHKDEIHVLNWRDLEHGGTSDEWVKTKDDIPADVIEWDIAGIKMYWRAWPTKGGSSTPVLQPDIDQPPDKVARIMDCKPRQRLNAANKDLWDKLKPLIPVAIIAAGLFYMFLAWGA